MAIDFSIQLKGEEVKAEKNDVNFSQPRGWCVDVKTYAQNATQSRELNPFLALRLVASNLDGRFNLFVALSFQFNQFRTF